LAAALPGLFSANGLARAQAAHCAGAGRAAPAGTVPKWPGGAPATVGEGFAPGDPLADAGVDGDPDAPGEPVGAGLAGAPALAPADAPGWKLAAARLPPQPDSSSRQRQVPISRTRMNPGP
jgi:hypothetical protein